MLKRLTAFSNFFYCKFGHWSKKLNNIYVVIFKEFFGPIKNFHVIKGTACCIMNSVNLFSATSGKIPCSSIGTLYFVKRRSSRPEMFCQKSTFKNFAKFKEEHLPRVSFSIKLQAALVFLWILRYFYEHLFLRKPPKVAS